MSSRDNAKYDYDIPSVTESTDAEAMDGSIPLKPAASVAKPVDVLKNIMISENAEVLFDPIVPLPGRNRVQGTASESEDKTRPGLLHSQDRQEQDAHTISYSSYLLNRPAHLQEECRQRMEWRCQEQPTSRAGRAIYEAIFCNPTTNPPAWTEDEIKLKKAIEKQQAIDKIEASRKAPEPPKKPESAPVPQVKLGPYGEIILDEQSLVIKPTESGRKVTSVVHEAACVPGEENKKRSRKRCPNWTHEETVRFYRALAALGTDFTLMTELFPGRSRKNLKVKFKREDKQNSAQIDKVLGASMQFDVEDLKKQFEKERAHTAQRAQRERELLAELKLAEKGRMKTAREHGVRRSEYLSQFDVEDLKKQFEKERAHTAQRAQRERELLAELKLAEKGRMKTAREHGVRRSEYLSQFDVEDLKKQFEKERAHTAQRAQRERELLAELKLAEKGRMKTAREHGVRRSEYLSQFDVEDLKKQFEKERAHTAQRAQRERELLAELKLAEKGRMKTAREHGVRRSEYLSQFDVEDLKKQFEKERAHTAQRAQRERELLAELKLAEKGRMKTAREHGVRRSEYLSQFDVEDLKKQFEKERAHTAQRAQRERELLAELKLAEKGRMKTAREHGVRRSRASKALEIDIEPAQLSFDEVIRIHNERKRAHRSATQTSGQAIAQATKVPTPGTPDSPQLIESSDDCISLNSPGDIETGFTVNIPSCPAKSVLETYIDSGPGQLSPGGATSVDSDSEASVAVMTRPSKRQRRGSFTTTHTQME